MFQFRALTALVTAALSLAACSQTDSSASLKGGSIMSLSSVAVFDELKAGMASVDLEAFRTSPTADTLNAAVSAANSATIELDGKGLGALNTYLANHSNSLTDFTDTFPTNGDYLDADGTFMPRELSISEFRDAFDLLVDVISGQDFGLTASAGFSLDRYDEHFTSYECSRLESADDICKNITTALGGDKGHNNDAMGSCGAAFWRARLDPGRKCAEHFEQQKKDAAGGDGSVNNTCKNDEAYKDSKCRQIGNVGGDLKMN